MTVVLSGVWSRHHCKSLVTRTYGPHVLGALGEDCCRERSSFTAVAQLGI